MAYLVDVNVLVAVLRADSPHHAPAQAWLYEARRSASAVVALTETLVATVRILTNSRIWHQPSSIEEATNAVDQLVSLNAVSVVSTSPRTWQAFTEFVDRVSLTHRDVPDCLLAAQAVALPATLITFDRGFKRFPHLTSMSPLTS